MQFATTETIRRLDAEAVRAGTPAGVLMERAGYGAFWFLTEIAFPGARRAIVVVGKGNNGGDASVVARHLALSGRHVELVMLCDPQSLEGCAKENFI